MYQDLISEADYELLPSEPQRKFLALEQICRKNLFASISGENGEYYDTLIRLQYMTIVATAAEELGIDGVYIVDNFSDTQSNLEEFFRLSSGVVNRLRLRTSSAHDTFSVKLANKTKGIIEAELSKLREAISTSELEEGKRTRLLIKVEDFRTELHKDRLRFAPAMAILVAVSTAVAGTTGFLANAPQAVSTIMGLIGQDKALEDAELFRLGGPKAQQLITSDGIASSTKTNRHIDEDIPF
jgi:hypothetical protein